MHTSERAEDQQSQKGKQTDDFNNKLLSQQILKDHEDKVLSLFQSAPDLERELEGSSSFTKEALLTFKDQLRIPDSKWQFVIDMFGLSKEFSLHQMRKWVGLLCFQRKLLGEMEVI